MPPKSTRNMGSLAQNSAEANNNKSKRGGMLASTKNLFSTRKLSGNTSTASKASSGSRTERNMAQSVQPNNPSSKSSVATGRQTAPGGMARNSIPPNFGGTGNRLEIPEGVLEGGVPTSITALTDAASCLTDGFDESVVNPHRKLNPPFYQPPGGREQNDYVHPSQRRMPDNGTDAAGRALNNMHMSGGGSSDRTRPRIRGSYNINDEGPLADQTGGGVLDDSYTGRSTGSGQMPGYSRRTTTASSGEYSSGSMPGYNRRTTSASAADHSMSGRSQHTGVHSRAQSMGHGSTEPPMTQYNRTPSMPDDYDYGAQIAQNRIPEHMQNKIANKLVGKAQSAQQRIVDKRRLTVSSNNTSRSSHTQSFNNSGQQMNFNNGQPNRRTTAAEQTYQPVNNKGQKPNRRSTTTTAAMTSLRASNNSQGSGGSDDHPRMIQGHPNDISDRTGTTYPMTSSNRTYDPMTSSNRTGMTQVRENMNRNITVTNTGRGDASHTTSGSQPHSPNSSQPNSSQFRSSNFGSSTSSSMHMSSTAHENPSWFDKGNDNNDNYDDDDDDDDTFVTMATKAQALRPSAMNKAKDMKYPQGDVTIIYTDVQGSTSFWETCPTDMKAATDIHDRIMRRCYTDHQGYEITTEGDAFNLAFQHPADALAFALQAQMKLFKAEWPEGILKHPDGKDEPALKYRGFRVRFGIHHGPTQSRVHEMTGRIVYSGEAVKISKAVEGMCHGGQILTTMETWKAVSGMAERYLGRPQILDCGDHLLFETKNQASGSSGVTTTRYTRRIMQLVPSDLAFDFFEARGRRDVPNDDGTMGYEIKDASNVSGRLFPPLISKRQLTTCFLNAPYANGKVTICFVYTVGLGDSTDNKNLAVLAKYVRKQILVLSPPGYECQEDNGCWMLAFDRMANAVTFGLNLKAAVQGANDLVGSVDRENMFKVGIISGPFTSMGPHKTTGMADYFGPIVNRASRVASQCEHGQVCVGIALSNGVTADPPDFGPTINVRLQGIKKLKGITIDVAVFSCNKRRIENIN